MRINQLKAGAILSYFSMAMGYIIALIYTPIMLRLLGQSEYGLYSLVESVVSYLGILNFGFGSAYIRYYFKYKLNDDDNQINRLNGMFLIIFSCIGILSVCIGILMWFNTDILFGSKITSQEHIIAKKLLSILIINVAIQFPNIVFNSFIIAKEKFIFQKVLQMIKVIMTPIFTILVLHIGFGSIGMGIVVTLINISLGILNLIYCFKKLGMRFKFNNLDFKLIKEIAVFSSYIFLYIVMDQVLWNVDKFILGIFWGTNEVAVYSLASQLSIYYISLVTTVSSVFVPRVNQIVLSGNSSSVDDELTELVIKVGRIQFVISLYIMLGIVFIGKSFIVLWAGKNYIDSYYIALLLIIPVTFPLIQSLGIEIQRAKNRQKFLALVYIGIAVFNILLSIPLAKLYGGIGSAFGTAVALLLGNVLVANWYYHFRLGLNMKKFWISITKLLPASIIPIILGLIILAMNKDVGILRFLILGCTYTLVYFVSMWFLGFNKFEKDLIKRPAMLVISKLKI